MTRRRLVSRRRNARRETVDNPSAEQPARLSVSEPWGGRKGSTRIVTERHSGCACARSHSGRSARRAPTNGFPLPDSVQHASLSLAPRLVTPRRCKPIKPRGLRAPKTSLATALPPRPRAQAELGYPIRNAPGCSKSPKRSCSALTSAPAAHFRSLELLAPSSSAKVNPPPREMPPRPSTFEREDASGDFRSLPGSMGALKERAMP